MAVIINATTTTGLTTSADNSGVIQFQSNGANTVGISSTGYITVGGNQQIAGPAFSAYQSSGQTLSSNTWTKVSFQTEEFDTNNNFDSTTNYRFTPTVAGYYQFSGGGTVNTSATGIYVSVYKNGSSAKNFQVGSPNASAGFGSCLIYMNGSTDYAELYMYINTGQSLATGAVNTYFQGAMVRGA